MCWWERGGRLLSPLMGWSSMVGIPGIAKSLERQIALFLNLLWYLVLVHPHRRGFFVVVRCLLCFASVWGFLYPTLSFYSRFLGLLWLVIVQSPCILKNINRSKIAGYLLRCDHLPPILMHNLMNPNYIVQE